MKVDPCDYPDTSTEMTVLGLDSNNLPINIDEYNEFNVTITLESILNPPKVEFSIFTTRNDLSG